MTLVTEDKPWSDCSTPSNYRPISILSVSSKLIEKHIHHQLSWHLHTNNLLHPLQSGFRPSHSTQTLFLHIMDKWYGALDSKMPKSKTSQNSLLHVSSSLPNANKLHDSLRHLHAHALCQILFIHSLYHKELNSSFDPKQTPKLFAL